MITQDELFPRLADNLMVKFKFRAFVSPERTVLHFLIKNTR